MPAMQWSLACGFGEGGMMTTILQLPADEMAKRLTESLHSTVEEKIRIALMAVAESVVRQAAKEMAANLKGNIQRYDNMATDQIMVTLNIDGVKQAIDTLDKPPGVGL